MDFFRRFFPRRNAPQALALPVYPQHMGAGCAFTDRKHVLAGYQPHKKRPGITGIGGHREGTETYLETAYRETIEEIFNVTSSEIPKGLIEKLIRTMKPRKFTLSKGYVIVTFTFEDLNLFLKLCRKSGLKSPLYAKMPTNLLEVIQTRGYDLTAEISSFALLPVVKSHVKLSHFVNIQFVKDMRVM